MRTARSSSRRGVGGRSASVHTGIPPGVGLETHSPTGVGLETPPGVGVETPQARPLNFPLGCEPGDLQGMLGHHPPPRPAARHADIPPAMHAEITTHPPPEQNHRHV